MWQGRHGGGAYLWSSLSAQHFAWPVGKAVSVAGLSALQEPHDRDPVSQTLAHSSLPSCPRGCRVPMDPVFSTGSLSSGVAWSLLPLPITAEQLSLSQQILRPEALHGNSCLQV